MSIKKYIPIGGLVLQDMGAWSSTQNYALGYLVYSNGITYRCIVPNLNHAPPDASYWTAYTAIVNAIVVGTWGTSPSNTVGNDGDIAIDTSTTPPTMYGPKSAGSWPSPGVQLGGPGTPGSNGLDIIFTNGVPSNSIGVNGQIALDYINYNEYIKSGGSWVLVGNYQGPQGDPGQGVTNNGWIPESGTQDGFLSVPANKILTVHQTISLVDGAAINGHLIVMGL